MTKNAMACNGASDLDDEALVGQVRELSGKNPQGKVRQNVMGVSFVGASARYK